MSVLRLFLIKKKPVIFTTSLDFHINVLITKIKRDKYTDVWKAISATNQKNMVLVIIIMI